MPWTTDVVGLVRDLMVAPYPTLVLRRDLGAITDSAMRRLIVETILATDAHRIADEVGPEGTPYDCPGGRQWRMAVGVRAASLLRVVRGTPSRDVVVSAMLLGTLAPGSSRTHPHPLAVQATLRRALRSQEPAVARAARLALGVIGRAAGPPPTPAADQGAVRLAGYAADRFVAPGALVPPIHLPSWADPDRDPCLAADELMREVSRARWGHRLGGQFRAAAGTFRRRPGPRYP
jgi:hypothetical protein